MGGSFLHCGCCFPALWAPVPTLLANFHSALSGLQVRLTYLSYAWVSVLLFRFSNSRNTSSPLLAFT
jgi:hypothetical protein